MAFRTLDTLDPKGKRILLRADLNVPVRDGVITDRTRIERLCPTIAELRARLLEAGALCASVTGSGPTVFGVFEGAAAARRAADKLSNMSGFSVQRTATASA